MAGAFDLSKLRVVCFRCSARATLLLVEFEAYQDAVLVWCECHGEHVLALVDGELLASKRHRDPVTETIDLNMATLRKLDRDDVEERRDHARKMLVMAGKRLDACEVFLDALARSEPTPGATS